jgi:hypothetical protein
MSTMEGGGLREAIRRRRLGRGGEAGEVQLELERSAAWSAEVGRAGLEVRCTGGALLVTMEGDPEDHELSPGQAFVASRRGRLVVWALEAARVRVTSPCRAAGAARGKVSLGAGLIGPGRNRS